jgi:dipeptidyl aminopeptidase/acylaminoacyl peptidase
MVFKKRRAEDPAAYEKASPVARVHPDAPPFFVIHGTHDSLAPVDEARDFVALLRKVSKSPVAYAEIPGAQHAFEIFHSVRTTHVVRGVDRFLTAVHDARIARDAA